MADAKISELTAIDAVTGVDLLAVVDDPAGTPATKKATATQLKDFVVGAGSVSVASGKTLTASNTLTLAGTDSTTMTFPSTSATLARTDAAQTFTGAQTITGGTLNGTVLDISQTWGGTGTYTGLRYNVTDSGPSNAASLLMDLQVGGASRFRVSKDGGIVAQGSIIYQDINGTRLDNFGLILAAPSIQMRAGVGQSVDTTLRRRGAANLQLGAADAASPVAQTLSVQSVVAGTSNTAGANLTITGSQGTGTGAGGSIIFQVAPAGSSGTAQNALATALTIGSDRTVTAFNLAVNNGFGTISTSTYFLTSSFTAAFAAVSSDQGGSNVSGALRAAGVIAASDKQIAFASTTSALNGTPDTILARDAANTLALRNGNNGQTFRVYGRFTSSTDHERFFVTAPTTSGAAVQLGTDKGSGGGTARNLEIQTDGTTRVTVTTLGNVVTNTAAVATTATDGFLYVPTCAGTPTGTPTTQTGTAPIVVDTTNNKLYFYSGGQWRDAGP